MVISIDLPQTMVLASLAMMALGRAVAAAIAALDWMRARRVIEGRRGDDVMAVSVHIVHAR